MEKILITGGGIALVSFIYWFFFGQRDDVKEPSGQGVDIIVDGGYKPSTIKVLKGQEVKLTILRKDPNSCLEEIILPDFKIKKYLPLNKKVEISFTPDKSGEFGFHCGMNMYHGKVVVS